MIKAVLLLLLLVALSGRAEAGWEKTWWGMSYDEVAVSGAPPFFETPEVEKQALSSVLDGEATFSFYGYVYGKRLRGFFYSKISCSMESGLL